MKAAALAVSAALLASPAASAEEPLHSLAVCADPDNMPFSNAAGEGFEDKLASMIADDLHAELDMVWRSSRRGFVRRTLGSGACDLIMATVSETPGLLATRPYYKARYVVVSRRSAPVDVTSYDDPALRKLRIGLQAVGAEGANTPPAMALARRGVNANITGYVPFSETPGVEAQGVIVEAVARNEIDAAFVWGPIGGYFARDHGDTLAVSAAPDDPTQPKLAFAYDIAIGVRKDEPGLRDKVNEILERRRLEVAKLLAGYGLPADNEAANPSPNGAH